MSNVRPLSAARANGSSPAQPKSRQTPSGVAGWIANRASQWNVSGPDERLMRLQMPAWNLLMDHYFRMEMEGWDRLPAGPSLMIGVHSGGSLTMDAWTVG